MHYHLKQGILLIVLFKNYISLSLNHILITPHLYGLRTVLQLIALSFYKIKLIQLLTSSHAILIPVLYSKNFYTEILR